MHTYTYREIYKRIEKAVTLSKGDEGGNTRRKKKDIEINIVVVFECHWRKSKR